MFQDSSTTGAVERDVVLVNCVKCIMRVEVVDALR